MGAAPGQIVKRRFDEFQELDAVVSLRYGEAAPVLPPSALFGYTEPGFVAQRAAELVVYLDALLQLEPMPKTRALRRFLGISQPLRDEAGTQDPPLLVRRCQVPVAVV